MKSYVARIWKKLVILGLGMVVGLLIPGLVVIWFINALPASTHKILNHYLSPDGTAFSCDRFKANASIGHISVNAHSPNAKYVNDITFIDHNNRTITLSTWSPNIKEFATNIHTMVTNRKTQEGIEINGESSGAGFLKHSFSDRTYCVTKYGTFGVVRMIAPDSLAQRPEEVLEELNIFAPITDRGPLVLWAKRNEVPIVIVFISTYCILWVLGILLGGEWAATVKPEPETPVKKKATLKEQMLALNNLDTPFTLHETGEDVITATWKHEGKWANLFNEESIRIVHEIRMRLRENRREVTVLELRRQVERSKGFLRFSVSYSIMRTITFFSYEHSSVYAITFKNGYPETTGNSFTLNIQEIKNPLIELVVSSGWAWCPKIFRQ